MNPIETSRVNGSLLDSPIDKPRVEVSSAKKLNYVLIMPVWGEHHTGLFLSYCLPFLLTDGNVGAFADRQLRVCVMSRRADFARMNQDINYRRLSAAVELVETEIDGIIDLSAPYRAMTECYLMALRALPNPDDTVTIFPTPDCVISRNALRAIIELMEDGWRGVMVCGLRLTLETAGPLLDQITACSGGPGKIGERELCQIVLQHLHPISLDCDVKSDEFIVDWPSHVYWVAPDRTWLLAHCFHLHPLAVRGIPANVDVHTTIDGDYLVELGASADKFYVCDSSDKLICFELSPRAKRVPGRPGRLRTQDLLRFSVSACNPLHREFFARAIWWKAPGDPVAPDDVLQEAADYVAVVRRGSFFEEVRFRVLSIIRKCPPLLFAARALVRAARRTLPSTS